MALERMTTKLSRHLEARWLWTTRRLAASNFANVRSCAMVTITALSPLDEG
jgi:hypothetical protein